jgi:hypothetical protein
LSVREYYDPDNVAFQAVVARSESGALRVRWQPAPDAPPEITYPSLLVFRAYQAVVADWEGEEFTTAVATTLRKGPDGPTLEQLALEHGLW